MKIVILCPAFHFHSPIVLREVCLKRKGDEITVISTPKLSKNKSSLGQIRHIIAFSGLAYLTSMLLAHMWFVINCWYERYVRKTNLEDRKFLTNKEVIDIFKLRNHYVYDINSEESLTLLREIKPDVIIADLFNQIIRAPVRDSARVGCFNIHTSYLPKYRGIAPNVWCLVNNEKDFGTSIHYVTDKVDAGPVAAQKEIPIYEGDTVYSLYRRCTEGAAGLLIGLLEQCEKGKPQGAEQDESIASYYSNITKEAVKKLFSNKRRFF